MELTQRKSESDKQLACQGFTVKSMLKNAKVIPPPSVGAFSERPSKPTAFRKFYLRGDFPIALEHDTKGNKIAWKVCVFDHTTTWLDVNLIIYLFLCCILQGWNRKVRLSPLFAVIFWRLVWDRTSVWVFRPTGHPRHARTWRK